MAKQTKGFCKYCGKEYARRGMLQHLPACKERKDVLEAESGNRKCGYYELVVSGKYVKGYWLIIEMPETATLKDLDRFIRDIWVECCGHLSAFEIEGVRYESSVSSGGFWGPPAKSMNCKLEKVLSVGLEFEYEYDFGSTTELLIKVQDYRTGIWKKEPVTILSRNNPPQILCSICEKNEAQWVNPQGFYDGDPFWCEECMQSRHEQEMEEEEDWDEDDEELEDYFELEEFILPVCNSPRMGVCGYEGSKRYPDQFEPDMQKGS